MCFWFIIEKRNTKRPSRVAGRPFLGVSNLSDIQIVELEADARVLDVELGAEEAELDLGEGGGLGGYALDEDVALDGGLGREVPGAILLREALVADGHEDVREFVDVAFVVVDDGAGHAGLINAAHQVEDDLAGGIVHQDDGQFHVVAHCAGSLVLQAQVLRRGRHGLGGSRSGEENHGRKEGEESFHILQFVLAVHRQAYTDLSSYKYKQRLEKHHNFL